MQATATKFSATTALRTKRAWLAWGVMIGVTLFVVAGLGLGLGAGLRLAFPAIATVAGAYLYWRYPVHYVGFTWWIWMLSPFVRRLVDWQSGPVDPSPVLLAPVLVSFVAGAGLLRHGLRSVREGGLPFVLAFAGVLYGLGVGLLRSSFDYTLAQPMLTWLTPLFIGFHLFLHWREYPRYRQILQRTFLWGALLMGIYGIAQFLIAPVWDGLWMTNLGYGSFGSPEPLEIRVFSTLNAPGPFAMVMMAALLVLFSVRGWLRLPAAVVGYLSFLLSSTRSAWIGWAVGFVVLLLSMNLRARVRLLVVGAVLAAAIVPLTMLPQFEQVLTPRLQGMTKPKEDVSLSARLEGYGRYLHDALDDPLGKGLGVMDREYAIAPDSEEAGPHDSAILELLLSLGFPGTAFYGLGLLMLLFSLRPQRATRGDVFVDAARAIGVAMFIELLFGSVMLSVMGVVLWGFCGIVLAAQKYYAAQQVVTATEYLDNRGGKMLYAGA